VRRALTRILPLLCVGALACAGAGVGAAPALAAGDDGRPGGSQSSLQTRVEHLQQDLDSLTEDVDDLREPVGEFDLFDQCAYTIGVTQYGRAAGGSGFFFGAGDRARRPALALDIRGVHRRPQFLFLAFPSEEPPSIECNEDAGQEIIDN
jgi:hypothetical protein